MRSSGMGGDVTGTGREALPWPLMCLSPGSTASCPSGVGGLEYHSYFMIERCPQMRPPKPPGFRSHPRIAKCHALPTSVDFFTRSLVENLLGKMKT